MDKPEKKVPNPKGRKGDKLSLWPLSFEDVLADVLKVPPEEKTVSKKQGHKKDKTEKD